MHPNYAYNLSVVRVLIQTVKLAAATHEPPLRGTNAKRARALHHHIQV